MLRPISRLRDLTRSWGKTSVRLVNRGPGVWNRPITTFRPSDNVEIYCIYIYPYYHHLWWAYKYCNQWKKNLTRVEIYIELNTNTDHNFTLTRQLKPKRVLSIPLFELAANILKVGVLLWIVFLNWQRIHSCVKKWVISEGHDYIKGKITLVHIDKRLTRYSLAETDKCVS